MKDRLHVDGAGWHPGGEDVPWLPLLQEAVWSERQLRMEYANNSGNIGWRIVQPLGLVLKGSLWYLVALPVEPVHGEPTDSSTHALPPSSIEPRSFRVSRVRSAELLLEPVSRPDGFHLAEYWERSVRRFRSELPRYTARAMVREGACSLLERTRFVRVSEWGEASADSLWREAVLEFDTLESACAIALSFGTDLLILEPPELRQAIVARANAVIGMYDRPQHLQRDNSQPRG